MYFIVLYNIYFSSALLLILILSALMIQSTFAFVISIQTDVFIGRSLYYLLLIILVILELGTRIKDVEKMALLPLLIFSEVCMHGKGSSLMVQLQEQ